MIIKVPNLAFRLTLFVVLSHTKIQKIFLTKFTISLLVVFSSPLAGGKDDTGERGVFMSKEIFIFIIAKIIFIIAKIIFIIAKIIFIIAKIIFIIHH